MWVLGGVVYVCMGCNETGTLPTLATINCTASNYAHRKVIEGSIIYEDMRGMRDSIAEFIV